MSQTEKHVVKKHKGEEPKHVKRAEQAYPATPFDDMERMFAGLFPRGWLHPLYWEHPFWGEWSRFGTKLLPRVDVIDRDNEVVVHAQIPGVNKKDLEVSVSDHLLTIKGSTTHEEKEEKGDYYRRECSHGAFSRTIALPDLADISKAKATFENGVLELVMPKTEKSKRQHVTIA